MSSYFLISFKSAFCSNAFPDPVDIYEVKRSQRHLLVAIHNTRLNKWPQADKAILKIKSHLSNLKKGPLL